MDYCGGGATVPLMSKGTSDLRSPALVEAVLEQLPDAVIVYDLERKIVFSNGAAEKLFGVGEGMLTQHHCHSLFRCAQCEVNCGVLVSLGDSPNVNRSTVRMQTVDGHERLVVINTQQIYDEQGELAGAVATVRDITEGMIPKRREIIAESEPMKEVMAFVRRIASSEAVTILLEGENGTGKDLIAKMLHYESTRRAEPFIVINCAAIPDTLLESELFGYEKGAFTDAKGQKRGLFELADNGTLFLDEIGELTLPLQAKLLRVLENQSFRRLGGLKDVQINARVITATNRDLAKQVDNGLFRQDLYYRLNVIYIQIPPLRERREDILPLANFFVETYNSKFHRRIEGLTAEASQLLVNHDWPGNVRELRNAIERAMILEDTTHLRGANLPIAVREHHSEVPTPVGLSLVDHEKQLIVEALKKASGNQSQAAKLLDISRDTLRYRMKKFNLK